MTYARSHSLCDLNPGIWHLLGPELVPLRGPVASSHRKGRGRGKIKGNAKSDLGLHRTIASSITNHIHTFACVWKKLCKQVRQHPAGAGYAHDILCPSRNSRRPQVAARSTGLHPAEHPLSSLAFQAGAGCLQDCHPGQRPTRHHAAGHCAGAGPSGESRGSKHGGEAGWAWGRGKGPLRGGGLSASPSGGGT